MMMEGIHLRRGLEWSDKWDEKHSSEMAWPHGLTVHPLHCVRVAFRAAALRGAFKAGLKRVLRA